MPEKKTLTIEVLQEIAERLYDGNLNMRLGINQAVTVWLTAFTRKELISLWEKCCDNLDLPYDDEVYNALNSIGYFKE